MERREDWVIAIFQHLQISLMALMVAILIAIPLAIFIVTKKRFSEIVLSIAGVFQTIPSLALLGLFIPIFGIGKVPAVIVLVIYAIFPILQNTVTGLSEIDPSLKEAAEAFGMNKLERLRKFEIAIAMPVIVSGVRTSAVMVIGTATLAALIGAGGLGSFILLGIDRNDTSLILIGAISAAFLAIIFSAVIKMLEKRKVKTILISFAMAFIILIGSMIPRGSSETIVIAGKLGAEPEILINMYKNLIEENTDLKVELKPNFGKTTFLYEALKAGNIDIYPEFSGTIATSLIKGNKETSNDPDKVYQDAKEGILKQDNLVFLKPMKYQNTYAVAVKKDFSEKNNIKKISDLSKVENSAVAGFTLEFNDREDGNRGLKSLYGLNLNIKTMEPSLRYQAISNGSVSIVDAYSTDSDLKKYNLVVLEDDKHLFPPYQGGPLMKKEFLDKHPEVKDALEKLSGKISAEEMTDMNYRVNVGGESASTVARDYLVQNGLLKK